MKINKLLIVALCMITAVMLTSSIIGSTYAKYQTVITGNDSTVIAKWLFKDENNSNATIDLSSTKTFTFNLFNTIKEADTISTETDTINGKIAPGTGGKFEIRIKNASDVVAKHKLQLSETNASNVPIQYKLSTETSSAWASLTDFNSGHTSETTLNLGDTASISVDWRWIYGDDSSISSDTALGILGTSPIVMTTATVTLTQVD